MCQIYLSALTAHALETGGTLQQANDTLAQGDLTGRIERVLEIIFQSLPTDVADDGETVEGSDSPESELQKVQRALLSLTSDRQVVQILAEHTHVLWADPGHEWDLWIARRFKATLGGALLEACYRMCPQIEEGDLLLDLDAGPPASEMLPRGEGVDELWITECSLGGVGHIEAVVREYLADPRRFYHLVERALALSDLEMVDVELTRILSLLERDPDLQAAFITVREATTHSQHQSAARQLRRVLTDRGVVATHAVLNSLYARVLRPGSSRESDQLVHGLIRDWRAHEERLKVEIDARVFAFLASAEKALDQSLSHIDPTYRSDPNWRFQVLYGLLWPRGSAIRTRGLRSYNPFVDLPEPDRELLLDELRAAEIVVPLSNSEWLRGLTQLLMLKGVARLAAPLEAAEEMRAAITALSAVPVEVGFLHLYPHVQGVERSRDGITVEFHLREAIQ